MSAVGTFQSSVLTAFTQGMVLDSENLSLVITEVIMPSILKHIKTSCPSTKGKFCHLTMIHFLESKVSFSSFPEQNPELYLWPSSPLLLISMGDRPLFPGV
jgi:hypothetical protein